MVNLTCAIWIFRTLDSQGNPTGRAELSARILLVCRKAATVLVGLCHGSLFAWRSEADHQRPLQVNSQWPLQAESVAVRQPTDWNRSGQLKQQEDSGEQGATGRVRLPVDARGALVEPFRRRGFLRSAGAVISRRNGLVGGWWLPAVLYDS